MSLACDRFCRRGMWYVPVCAGVRFCAGLLDGCLRQVIQGQCTVSLAIDRRLCMRGGVWHVLNPGGLLKR